MKERLFDLDPIRRAELTRVLALTLDSDPRVVFAYLYGSFASDQPFHDIDVGVYVNSAPSDSTRLAMAFADGLSQRAGYPVDVRVLNAAPIAFAFQVMRGSLLVSHDDRQLANVLERVGRRYLDLAPVLRRATREAFAP